MKCMRCKAVWEVAPHFPYPQKCPFCGTVMYGDKKDGADVLKDIISQYGYEILENRKRLSALIADLMVHRPKELIALRVAASEGIGDFFFRALNSEDIVRKIQVNRARVFIIDDLGMNEERAQFIIDSFGYALGLTALLEEQNYHDNDDAYYNLACEYDEKDKDIAGKLYTVSFQAGNQKATGGYISRIRSYWRSITDPKTWYQWNELVAGEVDNPYSQEACAEKLLLQLYGIGTERNETGAIRMLRRPMLRRFPEVSIELAVRRLCGLKPIGCGLSNAVTIIKSEADQNNSYAYCVQQCIEEYSYGEIESLFENEDDEDSQTADRRQELQGEIAYCISRYFHTENEIEKEYFWLTVGAEKEYVTACGELVAFLLRRNDINDIRRGIELLDEYMIEEELNWRYPCIDAQVKAASLYIEGDIVRRDLNKAFELLKACDEPDYLWMRGKCFYYGWGCDADRKAAIKCFEKCIDPILFEVEKTESRHLVFVYRVLPFLAQCYYEEMIDNDSIDALEKLQNLADYHGVRMAQKYLARYYLNPENFHHDYKVGFRYQELYNQNKNDIFSDKDFILDEKVIREKWIKRPYLNYGDPIGFMICFQDHLLFEACPLDERESNDEDRGEPLEAQLYFAFAMRFLTNTVAKNYLRAEIFFENYFESVGIDESGENYGSALVMYSRLLKRGDLRAESRLNKSKLVSRKAFELGSLTEKEYRLHIRDASYEAFRTCWLNGNKQNAVLQLQEAIDNGYSGAVCGYIGYFLILGISVKADSTRGFKWASKFYDDYCNDALEEEFTALAMLEMALGLCYLTGEGTEKNEAEGLRMWRRAIIDGNERDRELIRQIGNLFYEGDIVVNKRSIKIQPEYSTAAYAFYKAMQYGDRDAAFYLAGMYEEGLGVPANERKAKYLYQKAAYMGDLEAKQWLEGQV